MLIAMKEKPPWSFYVEWIVLNFITIVIAWFLTWKLVFLISNVVGNTISVHWEPRILEDFLYMYLLFPMIGLSTGIIQYTLLRHYLPCMARWIAATFLGWLLPFVVGALLTTLSAPSNRIFWLMPYVLRDLLTGLFASSNSDFWVIIGLSMIGFSTALPQWGMLRSQVRHASWWILACVFAWLLIGFLNTLPSVHIFVLMEISLIPTITTSIAWWLLLDWSPQHALMRSISGH